MALAIARYPLGSYQANCHVVRTSAGAAAAAAVDAGPQAAELRLELARLGTRCGAILVTHTDVDHIGAVAELADGTGAEVWCPADEADVLQDPPDEGDVLRAPSSPPGSGGVPAWEPEHLDADGDAVEAAGVSFEVVSVP